MALLRRAKDEDVDPESWSLCSSVTLRLLSVFIMIAGPLLLLYLNVRCEKNQCVLLQFPLVVPTHLSAYFSIMSVVIVTSFLLLMFLVSSYTQVDRKKARQKVVTASLSPSLNCLLSLSVLLVCIAYMKPDYIKLLRAQHLRLLSTTIVFSFAFSILLALLIQFNVVRKERPGRCFPMGLIHGFNTRVKLGSVDLKYFFYVHAGLVAWALVDLIIFVSFVLEKPLTAPLCFVFTTQYIMIVHTLMYEKSMMDRPFMHIECLGFFWLMRVLMYTPFLFSLPVLYASVTEITIGKPAMLANCALFMFGFVIYTSCLHQRENFVVNPTPVRSWKSILTNSGKRLLVGGYWGTIQKPDYLGFMIIWFSWVIACGMSAVSAIVMAIVYGTVFYWLYQTSWFHRQRYGSAWNRYTTQVPHKIIPLIF